MLRFTKFLTNADVATRLFLARSQTESSMSDNAIEHPGQDPALIQSVESALESLRPYLMADGGSVRLLEITKDMVVELELLGACGTCPMSTMTLRAGIEHAIRRTVPQIARVEAINAP